MHAQGWPLIFIVLAFAMFPGVALAQANFEEGVRHYKGGRYQHAVKSFSEAALEQPLNQEAHYYLANSLALVQAHQQAIAEYEMCYRLDPFGDVAHYCRQALSAYGCPVPTLTNLPFHCR